MTTMDPCVLEWFHKFIHHIFINRIEILQNFTLGWMINTELYGALLRLLNGTNLYFTFGDDFCYFYISRTYSAISYSIYDGYFIFHPVEVSQ